MSREELKLSVCPFCGDELKAKDVHGYHRHPLGGCLLSGYEFDDVAAWNRRAQDVARAPEGYMLVPIEPTPEIIDKMAMCRDVLKVDSLTTWRRVLEVIPEVAQAENDHIPRFAQTFCSQCGGEFGPGNHGFSYCEHHRSAPAAPAVAPASDDLVSMTRMFHAACADLGAINEALGLDPNDGGAAPIIAAIRDLQGRPLPENVEIVVSCLGDDAIKLREANPDDEMADNMDEAVRLLNGLAIAPAQAEQQACVHCKCNYPLHDLDCPVAIAGMRAKAEQQGALPECNGSHDYSAIREGIEKECTACTGEQQGDGGAIDIPMQPYEGLTAEFVDEVARLCDDAPGSRNAVYSALVNCRAVLVSADDDYKADAEQPSARVALSEDVLMQAVADTTARGHIWASLALSNYRAAILAASAAQTGESQNG